MDKSTHVQFTTKNFMVGIVGQLLTYLLSFVYRTVFIHYLGVEFLGVNGLFGNILSILSLAELGIGATITFSLYKPLAENDITKIKMLMHYFSVFYIKISILISILGICLIPFLDLLISGTPSIDNLVVIYILFLANSSVSYLYAYKRIILIADQREYLNTYYEKLFFIIKILAQIIVLFLTRNFILLLIVQIFVTIVTNYFVSKKVDKLYPYLKKDENISIDLELKGFINKKIIAMFGHRLGSIIVFNTDNLLISGFVGIYWVGLYSNYLLIVGIVGALIAQLSQSMSASLGNHIVSEDKEHTIKTFYVLYFAYFWIYSFSAITLNTLLNPFIQLWLGAEYLIEPDLVALIVASFYLSGMRQPCLMFRNSLGLFTKDQIKPVIEALINLIVSIILLKAIGLAGVFLGTIISTVTTSIWVEPYILYREYFKNGLRKYGFRFIYYLILTLSMTYFLFKISSIIYTGSVLSFLLIFSICIISINALYLIIFRNTKEFKGIIRVLKKVASIVKRNK